MTNGNEQGMSLPEVERALQELDRRQADLQHERGIYRRLGFSTERLRIALGQVATRRERLQALLARLEGERRADTGPVHNSRPHPQSPH
ncbi:MAG: hypothetical protein ACYC4L_06045 [Chloroflexota bacterium]